jgi:hypothetical protein
MGKAGNFGADLGYDSQFLFQFASHGIARRVRWQARIRRSFKISAATTRFLLLKGLCCGDNLLFFQSHSDEPSAIFNQFTIFGSESGTEMAVNIEFTRDLTVFEYGNDNF